MEAVQEWCQSLVHAPSWRRWRSGVRAWSTAKSRLGHAPELGAWPSGGGGGVVSGLGAWPSGGGGGVVSELGAWPSGLGQEWWSELGAWPSGGVVSPLAVEEWWPCTKPWCHQVEGVQEWCQSLVHAPSWRLDTTPVTAWCMATWRPCTKW